MTDTIGFDLFILVLRIAFIFLLYFFIFLVVRTITRELNRPSRRSSSNVTANYLQENYPSENPVGPVSRNVAQANGVTGRLVVTEVGNATLVRPGEIFQMGPIMPIGRLSGNAVLLDDDYVSSEHALLAWREGRWWLSDVASTNGTFLNGQPVTHPVQVNWGDLIGVGGVRLRLEP